MSGRNPDGGPAARAARARELNTPGSPAADVLAFYSALAQYQQRLVNGCDGGADGATSPYVVSGFSRTSGSLLHTIDAAWVGRTVRDFTLWLVRLKPDTTDLCDVPEEEWQALFEAYRADPDDAAGRFSEAALFALEAVLQPIAEHLTCGANPAGSRGEPDPGAPIAPARSDGVAPSLRSRCPMCEGAPVVGVLREEGHGAKRRLVCGLCLTEWDYLRVVCVKCSEQRFEALPVFSAEQVPHARVDACDTCRSYIKTIDATKDGRAVPVVDDLATIALDLWARERGYTRVRASLMGI
jgi:hypothetical protein